MTDAYQPRLAITMGDPAGIGPEVIAAAWQDPRVHEAVRPLVVGHPGILRRAVRLRGLDIEVLPIDSPSAADGVAAIHRMPVLASSGDEALEVPPREVAARGGQAAFDAVRLAAQLALAGEVDALVTAPLNKAALHAAGHHYPGHTELLAEMCGVARFAMMLYLPPGEPVRGPVGLGVVHVTLHQSLRSAVEGLTSEAIEQKCALADQVMRALGAQRPRLAVAALNPHAGEEGLFGDEERTIITPAVEAACRAGLDVSGPYPTDTLMVRARDGEFDAVVAMYHDQGHIALKLLGMDAAVNVTCGLPIVRTSVAHGTAFDRAWHGRARHEGMVAAIVTAGKLARQRAAVSRE